MQPFIIENTPENHLHLTILTGVSIVRNDDCNSPGTGARQCADQQQQLHHVIIYWRARRLDDVAVLAANIFMNLNVNFTVGKFSNRGLTQVDSQIAANFQGKGHVSIPAENLETTGMLPRLAGSLFDSDFSLGLLFQLAIGCQIILDGGSCLNLRLAKGNIRVLEVSLGLLFQLDIGCQIILDGGHRSNLRLAKGNIRVLPILAFFAHDHRGGRTSHDG